MKCKIKNAKYFPIEEVALWYLCLMVLQVRDFSEIDIINKFFILDIQVVPRKLEIKICATQIRNGRYLRLAALATIDQLAHVSKQALAFSFSSECQASCFDFSLLFFVPLDFKSFLDCTLQFLGKSCTKDFLQMFPKCHHCIHFLHSL